jgi:hypothetical protein
MIGKILIIATANLSRMNKKKFLAKFYHMQKNRKPHNVACGLLAMH